MSSVHVPFISRKSIQNKRMKEYPKIGHLVYESSSSKIFRHCISEQDENSIDFIDSNVNRGTEVAIKSFSSSCPSHEDLSCLNNEYNILSRYLVNCTSSVRRVLGRTKVKEAVVKNRIGVNDNEATVSDKPHATPAIYLEWIEGVTLQEIIEEWRSRVVTAKSLAINSLKNSFPKDDLIIVRLMHLIALAIADIHEAGVIHNDIASDNIIVSFENDDDDEDDNDNLSGSFSTKMIDFGYATTLAMAEANDSGETVNDDLYSLGVVYRDILLATNPSNQTRSSLTRDSISRIGDKILPGSVPESLCNVVACLTYGGTDSFYNPPYKSAREVAEDLEQMIEDPDVFLYEKYKDNNGNTNLVFKPNKLYGRSGEVKRLLKAYEDMHLKYTCTHGENSKCPDIVLVSGYGGSGKTALVQCLKDPVIKCGGFFISGKFDALQRNTPYSALISALGELCAAIISNDNFVEEMRKNIMSAVGSEGVILTELIPNLNMIIKCSEEQQKNVDQASFANDQNIFADGMEAQNKLSFVFRKFMRAVSTRDHPLVMVLDDLQWADTASLNLIQSVVTDSENVTPLLIVGCYRNNELQDENPLQTTLNNIKRLKYNSSKKQVDVINIDNLSREYVNEMISDMLLTKRRVTQKVLASLVHQKANGNPLFTIQFLKSLVDDGLLFFKHESKRWCWDEDGIRQKNVSNGVVELLTHNIKNRLSENTRNLLELAACIGSSFEVHLLEMVIVTNAEELPFNELRQSQQKTSLSYLKDAKSIDILETLNELVDGGFLVDIEPNLHYKFAHDRVHEAAYTCIPDSERTVMHYQIGEIMWKMLHSPRHNQGGTFAGDPLQYILADQLNRGSSLISDKSKRISLARLNLLVAESCTKKTSYETAVTYLESGIRLLDKENCWQEHYSLSLCLYNTMAKAQYSTGNFEEIPKLVNEVFVHAKSFEDKLNTYSTQMLVLGAQGKAYDAIQIGLDALAPMGEKFPNSISRRTIVVDVMRTKWMLRRENEASILGLPFMTDRGKIRVMQFLSTIVLYSAQSKPMLLPLVVNRMIHITISYGICESSAFAFATLGFILCSKFGDRTSGRKYGQLSLSLVKKCGGKKWIAKIYYVVGAGIDYLMSSPLLGHDYLLDGHINGMEAGDLEYAGMCAVTFMCDSFFSGEFLVRSENKCRMLCHQFAEYNQESSLRLCIPIWQAILNLLGKSENPDKMSGEAMNFGTSLNMGAHQMTIYHQKVLAFFEIYLAFMFGMNELAAEKSERVKKLFSEESHPRFKHFFIYYTGLNYIVLANATKKRKWEVMARKNIKEFKKLAKKLPRHFLHKDILLRAKYVAMKGKREKAARMFDAAITAAATSGISSDEALANEEAGIFFHKVDEKQRANQCLVNAYQCYLNWGAQAKADYLYNCFMIQCPR